MTRRKTGKIRGKEEKKIRVFRFSNHSALRNPNSEIERA
jgi:hypothetical protein